MLINKYLFEHKFWKVKVKFNSNFMRKPSKFIKLFLNKDKTINIKNLSNWLWSNDETIKNQSKRYI